MNKLKTLLTNRIARFIVVGVLNTAISFGILNLAFYKFHQGKIVSSIIATSCALAVSFVLNRNYVFADKSKRAHKQLLPFVAITVSGSLLVLNAVYILSLKLLSGHETLIIDAAKALSGVTLSANFVDINLSTVFGAVAALLWNYNGYRMFVFASQKPSSEADE